MRLRDTDRRRKAWKILRLATRRYARDPNAAAETDLRHAVQDLRVSRA